MKEAVTENIYRLPLVLEPQPEGGWTITCPILRGLITEADTIDEIVPNVTDALECLIEGYEELGQPLPVILPEKLEFEIKENFDNAVSLKATNSIVLGEANEMSATLRQKQTKFCP